jgi:hypothetical protein
MRTLLVTTSEVAHVALAVICILSSFGVKVSRPSHKQKNKWSRWGTRRVNTPIQPKHFLWRGEGQRRTFLRPPAVLRCSGFTTRCLSAILVLPNVPLLTTSEVRRRQVSTLTLPLAGLFCIACKDIFFNVSAGFFLLGVQPFRVGDTVATRTSRGSAWFEVRKGDSTARNPLLVLVQDSSLSRARAARRRGGK